MNIGNQNFDELQRLLKIKRYEQPPPGYFNRFSEKVVARIEKGEVGEVKASPWLTTFLRVLDANPILAGALGVVVCGSLIGGIIFSQQGDGQSLATASPVAFNGFNSADNKQEAANADSMQAVGLGGYSTNAGSTFGEFGSSLQPVNFSPAN